MADRYWVGGTGNWDASDTSHWAIISGGAGGASVPSSVDNVIFDSLSNASAYTVTVSGIANCLDLTINNPLTGAVTWAGSSALSIYGSLLIASGITRTYNGAITYRATTTGKTLTFNSTVMSSPTTFDGIGGGWTLQDNWNNNIGDITLTRGSLDTNGKTVAAFTFGSSNSNTRTLSLGSSILNVSGTWNFGTVTGLTFNVSTSTINLTSGGGNTFIGGGLTYNIVTLVSTGAIVVVFQGANTFATLSITGPANKTQKISFNANQIITGTLTITGNSLTNRVFITSDIVGTTRTITANAVSLSNCDFQDITGAGVATWSGTSLGNALGNSGITFTTPVTRYAVVAGSWSSTATWSVSSGGAGGASVPLCHDTVILDALSNPGTYTMDMPRVGADITCTDFKRTLTNSVTNSIYGSLILGSEMALSASMVNIWDFYGRSSHTIKCARKTIPNRNIFYAFGGNYSLQDNYANSFASGLIVYNGTFDANDYDVTINNFDSSATTARVIKMGSGTWTMTTVNGTSWNCSTATNLTLDAGTSTILVTDTTSAESVFNGGNKNYHKLEFKRGASTGINTINNTGSFNIIKDTGTVGHILRFTAGTTVTVREFDVTGNGAGNEISLNSSTTGAFNLIKSGGGIISCNFLNIQHCVATPASTWYAGINSVNNQAVATAGSGWAFTAPPTGNYFLKQDGGYMLGSEGNRILLEDGTISTTVYVKSANATFSVPSRTVTIAVTVAPAVQVATFSIPTYTVSADTILDVTVNPAVQSATFSIPTYTPSTTANPTINPTTQVATFSIPAPTIRISATISPAVQSAVFSTPAPTVNISVSVAPSVQTATFSIPAVTVTTTRSITVTPTEVTATFTIPAYSVSAGGAVEVYPSVVSATFSIPTYTVSAIQNTTITPAVQVATFSIPTYTVSATRSVTIAPSVQAMTFSVPSYAIQLGITVSPSVVSALFSIPTYVLTVTASITVLPAVQSALFSIPSPFVRGDFWYEKFPTNVPAFADKVFSPTNNWGEKFTPSASPFTNKFATLSDPFTNKSYNAGDNWSDKY